MAVSPAEDILRTLTYNYYSSTTSGSATYTQTTGIIKSNTTATDNNISCSCIIRGNNTTKTVSSNGHYSLTFATGSSTTNRKLNINLTMTVQGSSQLDVLYSFTNLGASQTYTITFDVDGFATSGYAAPRLYNITLVLGSTSYTYDDIFGPIATCSDIFTACGIKSNTPKTPSEIVYSDGYSNITLPIMNEDETYQYTFYIIDKSSQTYSSSYQGVRYADLKKNTYSVSSI